VFHDHAATIVANGHHGAGARAVFVATDERRRQPALARDADTGVWQLRIGRDTLVAQWLQQGQRINATARQPRVQLRIERTYLGPRRVQIRVGQCMHAGIEPPPMGS
jgi:hypothetical protein